MTLDIVDTVHVKKKRHYRDHPGHRLRPGNGAGGDKSRKPGRGKCGDHRFQKIYDREGTLAAEGSSDPLQTAPGEESRSGDPAHGGESGPLVRDGSRAVYGGDGDPKGTGRSWTVQRPVSDSAIIL